MNPLTRISRELGVIACVAAACWPLSLLTRGSADGHAIALVAGLVAAAGVLLRLLKAPSTLAFLGSLIAGAAGVAVVFVQQGFALSPSGARDMWTRGAEIIDKSVTPLPDKPATIVLMALGAAVVAWVVDYVGGTSRMPILTVLPLAAPLVVAASAQGATTAAKYFVAAALAWTLLALATFRVHTRTRTASHTIDRSSWFATISVLVVAGVAAALALQIPKAVPHRETPALAKNGGQGVDTSVDFSESLDLTKSLNSSSTSPVLRYETDATTPSPLRVTVSDEFRDGRWVATAKREETVSGKKNTDFPNPGYSDKVATTTRTVSATLNGMPGPLVAAPAPIIAANFGPGNDSFKVTKNTSVPLLTKAPASYSVLYREFKASSRPTSDDKVTASTESVTKNDLDTSAMPDEAKKRVSELTKSVTASKSTSFDKAVAIQRYFRTDPSYTYSLKLADTKTVNGKKLDPISNFLETKTGYCTQYATAMIMMARESGIPARMAIGFLPGERASNGQYTVKASDAHAWPELYFPGMGWTRFDPTPGSRSGVAPPYAPDFDANADASPSSSSSSTSSTSTTTSSSSSTPSSTPSAQRDAPEKKDDSNVLGTVLKVLGLLALLAALASILPLAGRRERTRLLRGASTPTAAAEGHWHELSWRMRDLGFPLRKGLSPRATAAAFRQDFPNSDDLAGLIDKVCARLEEARYAPEASNRTGTSAKDALLHAATQEASWPARLKAMLAPASGIAGIKRLFSRG